MPSGIVTNGVILRALGENMRKFKRRQRHSLPFCLFLTVVGALLLPAALAPRANAGSADYWFSEPQGVLINQPFASNSNLTLASNNVASGAQPGAFQPLVPDALRPWTGAVSTTWATAGNWTGGTPGNTDTAEFNSSFTNQPNLLADATVGSLLMTAGVAQNVTISSNGAGTQLTINGIGGTGILIDNPNAFTLTITAPLIVGADQAWTNNSGNLFTVQAVGLNNNALTVNGTGNTLMQGIIASGGGSLIKDGSGTLTVTANNTYGAGTIVNGGTLLVNGAAGDLGNQTVTVNSNGTLGGNSTAPITANVLTTVNAGGNLAPGNGGNNTAVLITGGAVTLASTSNFRIDINGTTAGTGYDRLQVNAGAVNITGSNLVVTVGTTLSVGQTFLILDKVAAGGITGTFAQGSTVVGSDGTVFSISYTAGTGGNDIQLTVIQAAVPEPSTWVGGTLAIAGLAFTQRRRLRKLIAVSR